MNGNNIEILYDIDEIQKRYYWGNNFHCEDVLMKPTISQK